MGKIKKAKNKMVENADDKAISTEKEYSFLQYGLKIKAKSPKEATQKLHKLLQGDKK